MMKYAVVSIVGNDSEVLTSFEKKEEMLAALDDFRARYAGQPGIICGICANFDENNHIIPDTDAAGSPEYACRIF